MHIAPPRLRLDKPNEDFPSHRMDEDPIALEDHALALEERARVLRRTISPLPTSSHALQAMWETRLRYRQEPVPAASLRTDLEPAPFETYLQSVGLKLGDVRGDGLCQYRAFSRAVFGDDRNHDELRTLAADFLMVHENEYAGPVSATELCAGQTLNVLRQLVQEKSVQAVDYHGWCEALKLGLIWGQDYTLQAMCKLMHVELRLVVNMRLQRDGQPPRLMFQPFDFSNEHGAPIAVVYLGLHQASNCEHYSTLEEDVRAQNLNQSSALVTAPSDVSARSDIGQTFGEDEVIVLGDEEYSIASLEIGVPCGDNQHSYRLERENDTYVVYKIDKHSGSREKCRSYPIKTASGQLKAEQMTQRASRRSSTVAVPVQICEYKKWLTQLQADGLRGTSTLAQASLDAINKYIDHLELTRSTGTQYLDRLGARMHELADEAKRIKAVAHFEAHSEGQQCFKVMVIGVEGSGKSTSLNSCLRSLMLDEATIKSAELSEKMEQSFSLRYHGEPRMDETPIHVADAELEEMLLSEDQDSNDGVFSVAFSNINEYGEDILPTGGGFGSLTALPTFVELDPSRTTAQLKLTYREPHDVERVLSVAAKMRELRDVVLDQDQEPPQELDGIDLAYIAHEACAILNIKTTGGNAITKLCNYEAEFTLPEHRYLLLGRVRTFTVEAPTRTQILQKINLLLAMHTLGPWSNWGIVCDVCCVLPAKKDGVHMTLLDVPGYGNQRSNPFRQGLVRKAVTNCEASTLLVCLDPARLDGKNNESRELLELAGVYEQLFGEVEQRKIGQVVVMTSLDWKLEKKLSQLKPGTKPPALHINKNASILIEQSEGWLRQSFEEAAKKKSIKLSRVEPTLNSFTKAFSIDVRGTVQQATGIDEFSLSTLTDVFIQASRDALLRRQQLLFHELVVNVMLPFYEEHHKMGYLRQTGSADTKFKVRTLHGNEGLLEQTLNAGDQALMGKAIDWEADGFSSRRSSLRQRGELDALPASGTSHAVHGGNVGAAGFVHEAAQMRKTELRQSVMEPILKSGTSNPTGLDRRWEEDEGYEPETFAPYRKLRSRQLGYDLKAVDPQETLLTKLIIPEMADDSVLPLQEKLREWKQKLIDNPIKAMYNQLLMLFSSSMDENIKLACNDEDGKKRIKSLKHTLCVSLQAWYRRELDAVGQLFSSKVMALPIMHKDSIKRVFREELPSVVRVHGNNYRKTVLGTKANSLAVQVAEATLQCVLNHILVILNTKLRKSFEEIVKETHKLMVAAIKKGDTQELQRCGAFTISQHYARFTAGLVYAIWKSDVLTAQLTAHLQEYVYLKDIENLAQQPAIKISPDKGLEELFTTSMNDKEEPETAGPYTVAPSDGAFDTWQCPNCSCNAEDCCKEMRQPYPLSNPCRFQPRTCWCEKIERTTKFCQRCVKYYKDKAIQKRECVRRPAKWEKLWQKREQNRKRNLSTVGGSSSPPAASRRRTAGNTPSNKGLVEEI